MTDEARRNEALRAQERDDLAAKLECVSELFEASCGDTNRLLLELAEMTKDYRLASIVIDELRKLLASVTAERDALREETKTVAERQREACAKTCELIRPGPWGNHEQQEALDNWKTAARFVRETPLVADAPAAEREATTELDVEGIVTDHGSTLCRAQDHLRERFDAANHAVACLFYWSIPHRTVAMANEAIREENALDRAIAGAKAAAEALDPCGKCHARIREIESQLAAAVAERGAAIRTLVIVRRISAAESAVVGAARLWRAADADQDAVPVDGRALLDSLADAVDALAEPPRRERATFLGVLGLHRITGSDEKTQARIAQEIAFLDAVCERCGGDGWIGGPPGEYPCPECAARPEVVP